VAVAANFAAAQEELARHFEETSGVVIQTSLGATGQLYAQIENGAPYDVFLAVDTLRPALQEDSGHAVSGTRFTYAVGSLALFAPRWDMVPSSGDELAASGFLHLAIANPKAAPLEPGNRVYARVKSVAVLD
jgi:molybdate transport system substrate-binding protein